MPAVLVVTERCEAAVFCDLDKLFRPNLIEIGLINVCDINVCVGPERRTATSVLLNFRLMICLKNEMFVDVLSCRM